MIRISDMIKNNVSKSLLSDNQLKDLLEKVFVKEGYYTSIEKSIKRGLDKHVNEVMMSFSIRSIKNDVRRYLQKGTTFTESQLCKAVTNWAKQQNETIEGKFEWRFEEDMYNDLYFYIWIGLE